MSRLRSATVIHRLITALEACAAEETGLHAAGEWSGLADLFGHELALLHRLAHEREVGGQLLADDTDLMSRVERVKGRHALLLARLTESHGRMDAGLHELGESRRRLAAVGGSYRLHAA